MLKSLVFSIFLIACGCAHQPEKKQSVDPKSLVFPTIETRKQMVTSLKSEIERIDGEGLPPRLNCKESWDNTIAKLREEAGEATTLYDLGRVFKRIDATYPNLHAKVYLIPELDEKAKEGAVVLPFRFYADKVDRKTENHRYLITTNEKNNLNLRAGDELVEINSKSIRYWTEKS